MLEPADPARWRACRSRSSRASTASPPAPAPTSRWPATSSSPRKSAKFIQSFSAIGLIPDSGGSWILPRLVGQARALGLALTGEPLPAEKAAEWGLIWKCVDDDALDAEVDALAAKLASLPPLGLAAIKAMIRSTWTRSLDEELTCSATRCAAWVSPTTIAKGSPLSSKSVPPNSSGNEQAHLSLGRSVAVR